MRYWLMKSEPECYSIDDLKRERVGCWDDIRNYQARNFIRDDMKKGDFALFYQSSAKTIGVVGLMKIIRNSYPDPSQFDVTHEGYDPKATRENPIWYATDVQFVKKFKTPFTLERLKSDPFFSDMRVIQKGNRLSIQPVAEKHYMRIYTESVHS